MKPMVSSQYTRELRASDADREATAERLRVAAIEGRLDSVELEERMAAALSARWCSELAQLTVDVTPAPVLEQAVLRPIFVRRSAPTNGLAIASLVFGVLWMWWIGSVLAIVFGHIALNQMQRAPHRQAGRAIAMTGMALGYLGLLLPMLGVIFAYSA
jgi:hypothetical protein